MISDCAFLRFLGSLLFLGLLVGGCDDEGTIPDVQSGTYRVRVVGAVQDTLSGPVRYRLREGGLVGFELGAQEGPGLSIQMERRPLGRRTYSVVDAALFDTKRPDERPGVFAFLAHSGAMFEATDGSLEVTYADEDRVGATFEFVMEGSFTDGPTETVAVHVQGTLNALDSTSPGSDSL